MVSASVPWVHPFQVSKVSQSGSLDHQKKSSLGGPVYPQNPQESPKILKHHSQNHAISHKIIQPFPDRVLTEATSNATLRRVQVVTWGSSDSGGDCGMVKDKLQNVLEIQATESWRGELGVGNGWLTVSRSFCAKHISYDES